MPNAFVTNIIHDITQQLGTVRKVGNGNSLFEIASNKTLIYFRYSKITPINNAKQKAFYGLRKEDVDALQGHILQGRKAFICLVWNNSASPILLPFAQFEPYIFQFPPANDGQYKVLLFFKTMGTEFYIPKVGKFTVDSFYGLSALYRIQADMPIMPKFNHSQIQSIIGAIGIKKGFHLWYPLSDRSNLDYSILEEPKIRAELPSFSPQINRIISEVDVIWLDQAKPINFFEVEHSTPIYSGLLRFNDILLTVREADTFNIVADSDREKKFSREINRPTFRQNNLIDKVSFLDYSNVYHWYCNLYGEPYCPV